MEWQRIVELHQPDGGCFGSGYLLAPGLVLTAAHVVRGLDETRARLLMPDEDQLPGAIGKHHLPARVAWRSRDHDLALLVPAAGAPPFREGAPPIVIGRLAERAAIRVDALGFPRALETPAHDDTLHIEALVSAWTGVHGTSLVLKVTTARPHAADGWKGMSGAAVFAGDRLVGVVEAVPARLAKGTLYAARADLLFETAAAKALLVDAKVQERVVDAAYVDALPRAGHWGGVRERYARAVVTTLCRIDHVGLAVGGVAGRPTPALAAFTAQRFVVWPDEGPAPR